MDKESLKDVENYEQFQEFARMLAPLDSSELFEILFEMSLTQAIHEVNEVASWLLVELEPEPTKTCTELMVRP